MNDSTPDKEPSKNIPAEPVKKTTPPEPTPDPARNSSQGASSQRAYSQEASSQETYSQRTYSQNASAQSSTGSVVDVPQDSKNLAVLNWVGTIFLGFLPGLILYLVQKEDSYVQDQSKEALNWSITLLFGYCIAFFLSFIVIGLFLFPILGVIHLVFCILGIVGTQKGETFRVPYAVRLIK